MWQHIIRERPCWESFELSWKKIPDSLNPRHLILQSWAKLNKWGSQANEPLSSLVRVYHCFALDDFLLALFSKRAMPLRLKNFWSIHTDFGMFSWQADDSSQWSGRCRRVSTALEHSWSPLWYQVSSYSLPMTWFWNKAKVVIGNTHTYLTLLEWDALTQSDLSSKCQANNRKTTLGSSIQILQLPK